jgi:hypothetical protein
MIGPIGTIRHNVFASRGGAAPLREAVAEMLFGRQAATK